MKSLDWKTAAELTGITAIVISLVFVGLQIQQDRALNQVSTFGSVTNSAHALSELVQGNSDVWVRGLDGDDLSDAEMAEFMSIIRAVETRYMNFIIRWTASGDDRLDPETHARNFAYYMYIYPGLRRVLEEEAELRQQIGSAFRIPAGGTPLYAFSVRYLKELDEAAPDIPANKNYVIW